MESLNKYLKKKGAIEVSISTVVILVIGVTMLIVGIVLVREIMQGALGATRLINENVKAQINKQFNEDENLKTVIYLPDNNAEVNKGKKYLINFGIKNIVRGQSEAGTFNYEIKAKEVSEGCNLSLSKADSYITLGKKGTIKILPGELKEDQLTVFLPRDAPLCSIRYDINFQKDGQIYDSNFFTINIEP